MRTCARRVDHSGEHPHVISGYSTDSNGIIRASPPNITTPDNHGQLRAYLVGIGQFFSNFSKGGRIDTVVKAPK